MGNGGPRGSSYETRRRQWRRPTPLDFTEKYLQHFSEFLSVFLLCIWIARGASEHVRAHGGQRSPSGAPHFGFIDEVSHWLRAHGSSSPLQVTAAAPGSCFLGLNAGPAACVVDLLLTELSPSPLLSTSPHPLSLMKTLLLTSSNPKTSQNLAYPHSCFL